jgi:hypothetical protein
MVVPASTSRRLHYYLCSNCLPSQHLPQIHNPQPQQVTLWLWCAPLACSFAHQHSLFGSTSHHVQFTTGHFDFVKLSALLGLHVHVKLKEIYQTQTQNSKTQVAALSCRKAQ